MVKNLSLASGTVTFHRIQRTVNKDLLRNYIQREMEYFVKRNEDSMFWVHGRYLVLFRNFDEGIIKCEIEIDFEDGRSLFSVAVARRANHAFNRAMVSLGSLSENANFLDFVA